MEEGGNGDGGDAGDAGKSSPRAPTQPMHIGTTSPVRVRGSPAAAYVVPVCVGCLALRAPQLERLHMAIPVTVAGLGTWERTFENSDFPKMTPVGFEPTQLALVELESTPLDHSGKVSLSIFRPRVGTGDFRSQLWCAQAWPTPRHGLPPLVDTQGLLCVSLFPPHPSAGARC